MDKKLFLMLAFFGLSFAALAQEGDSPVGRTFTTTHVSVEIAVNPAHSQVQDAAFYVEGYMYPVGTLAGSEHGGILEDGSAEFPDAVIGRWTCAGWFTLERPATELPVGAVTNQYFEFPGDGQGANMITTGGFEPGAFGPVYTRAVTGGTGMYADANGGEQTITIIGVNDVGGVNYLTTIQDTFSINFKTK